MFDILTILKNGCKTHSNVSDLTKVRHAERIYFKIHLALENQFKTMWIFFEVSFNPLHFQSPALINAMPNSLPLVVLQNAQ